VQIILGALTPASLYALIGVGFVIVYRTTRVLSFAQGQLALFGGYLYYALTGYFGGRYGWAVAALVVSGLLMGAILYYVIFSRAGSRGVLILVMLTIMVGTILQALTGIIWGTASQFVESPISQSGIHVTSNAIISPLDLTIFCVTVVLIAVLACIVRFTRHGLAMRAASENAMLASYRGVNVRAVAATAWAIATMMAFLAGLAFAYTSSVSLTMVNLGFTAFAAILIGGLDSISGVIIGSIVVALVQGVATTELSGAWSDVSAYIVIFLVLMVRPYGLFGTRELRRV
jgi:branched-chain amino acid transport system permease protein